MKNIKLISLHIPNLHNAEFGQFITRFFDDFEKTSLTTETDTDFKKLFDKLKDKLLTYNKALEKTRGYEESRKLADLDKVRDADLQALRDSIKPYRNAKKENQKEAYNALKMIFDSYKNVADEPYEKETNKINTLISNLKSEKFSSHVASLKIGDFVDELELSNNNFNTIFGKRSFEILQQETYDIKSLRKEMNELYRKISLYALIMAEVREAEFYIKALEVINNSRKYYADMLAIRGGKNKGSATPQ